VVLSWEIKIYHMKITHVSHLVNIKITLNVNLFKPRKYHKYKYQTAVLITFQHTIKKWEFSQCNVQIMQQMSRKFYLFKIKKNVSKCRIEYMRGTVFRFPVEVKRFFYFGKASSLDLLPNHPPHKLIAKALSLDKNGVEMKMLAHHHLLWSL